MKIYSKLLKKKYQCSNDKDFKTIKIKFDCYTILIEETENRGLHVKIKREIYNAEGLYSIEVLYEMFKGNTQKILDFIIFRTIEYYYTEM